MDWFAGTIPDETSLRALYPEPSRLVQSKQIDHLDRHCRDYLALCSFVLLASADAQGRADVTPRGAPPGFVTVLDDRTLAIADAPGNRRLDTLRNVVQTGQIGLLAVLPGRGQTLRVNGRAAVSVEPALLEQLADGGRPPRSALLIGVDEVYTHCPTGFRRSGLWDPATWPAEADQPSPAEMLRDHVGDPELTLAEVEKSLG